MRLVGNRTGEFKIRSLKNPDKIVEGVKSSNPHHGLLPGDVVYGAYVNDDYGFAARILVSRALREPVCTINYAKSARKAAALRLPIVWIRTLSRNFSSSSSR